MFFFKKKRRDKSVEAAAASSIAGKTGPQAEFRPAVTPADSVSFSGSVVSDVGCIRTNNEDNYILGMHMNADSCSHSGFSVSATGQSGHWQFAGVFDGMGGGDKGELASQKTARIFLDTFSRLKEDSAKQNVDLMVRNAFLEANNMIVALQRECNIFGTTGTVLCTDGKEFKIFHLGDSRAYLVREGRLFQLTKDQTLAQMKVDAGLYDENAPQAEADKHKLTEYIGRDWTRENLRPMESQWMPVQKTDRLLLCSDGLYDMCSDAEIEKILQKSSNPKTQVTELTEAARRNGGADNITCIVAAFS